MLEKYVGALQYQQEHTGNSFVYDKKTRKYEDLQPYKLKKKKIIEKERED